MAHFFEKKVGELKSFYGFVNRFWAILGRSPPLHDWLHFGCLFYFFVNGIMFLYVFFKCSALSFHPKSWHFRQICYLLISEWDALKCFGVKLKSSDIFYHMQHEKREKCFPPGSNRRPFACEANVITNYTRETSDMSRRKSLPLHAIFYQNHTRFTFFTLLSRTARIFGITTVVHSFSKCHLRDWKYITGFLCSVLIIATQGHSVDIRNIWP